MELTNIKINFMGDSITEGYGSSDKATKGLVPLIAKKTGAICRNYGIGGTGICPIDGYVMDEIWRKDYCERIEEMEIDADCVVIFGGTNDYGHGSRPLGKYGDNTLDTFYGAYDYLLKNIIARYTTSKICVVTPTHRVNESKYINRKGQSACLADYVKAIREVAEHYAVPVLDLYKNSGLQPEIPEIKEKYMPDGLHPNDDGYEILSNIFIKFLENL